jgi:HAD superfamily hydrolase (TIGR01509 family)
VHSAQTGVNVIKALIFDMDGVIVDSEPIHAKVNQIVLKRLHNIESTREYFYQFIGGTLPRMVEKINHDFNLSIPLEEWKDVAGQIKLDIIKRDGYPAVPYVVDSIRSFFDDGFLLAVASNSPTDDIQFTLSHLKVSKYFHFLVSGLSIPNPKPAPDIFLKVAEELNSTPKECLVFEDSHYGSLAANRAGMFCIGYVNPHSGNQDLSPAHLLIESFKTVNGSFVRNINIQPE